MSCNHFIEVFGSGDGIIKIASPQARLITGLLFFCAILILPLKGVGGIVLLFTIPALCIFICRPPIEILKGTILFGLAMFAPLILLIPFIPDGSDRIFDIERFTSIPIIMVPLTLFLKGIFSIIIFVSITSSMSMNEFVKAQIALRVPDFVVLLVAQIIHQTGLLYSETIQMAQAISLRCGDSKIKKAILLGRYLPIVWLERIYYKAFRVSNAMIIRDYKALCSVKHGSNSGYFDIIFTSLGGVLVLSSLFFRYCSRL